MVASDAPGNARSTEKPHSCSEATIAFGIFSHHRECYAAYSRVFSNSPA
jgi:hypothetical protein